MIVEKVLSESYDYAFKNKCEHVTQLHLMFVLLKTPAVITHLVGFGLKDKKTLIVDVENILKNSCTKSSRSGQKSIQKPKISFKTEIIIKHAIAQAILNGRKKPNKLDVFYSLLLNDKDKQFEEVFVKNGILFNELLIKIHIDEAKLQQINVKELEEKHDVDFEPEDGLLDDDEEDSDTKKNIATVKPKKNKKSTNNHQEFTKIAKTDKSNEWNNKNLKVFSEYMNDAAKNTTETSLLRCIGRDADITNIMHILSRKTKNSVLLVGQSGVGKSTIIRGLVKKIVSDATIPEELKNSPVFSLDVNALVAGAKLHGSFEERMKLIIDELSQIPNSILFIDDMHVIIGTGSSGNLDMSAILRTALSKQKIKVIGCVSDEDYRKHLDKDKTFTRRFYKIDITEPTRDENIDILNKIVSNLSDSYKIQVSHNLVTEVIDLTTKYMIDRSLPEKAIDVIDSTFARKKLMSDVSNITTDDIKKEISRIAKIDITTLFGNEKNKLLTLESNLKSKIFGQDAAITALVNTIFVSKAGLRSINKTQGNIFFHGATSCGKTELAKELAVNLGVELMRFDLSAYQDKFMLSALIGSPPGYVGYTDGKAGDGLLVNAIESKPNCVLLLDEVEKAHPDILNILLQIMDYGILSSASGKSVNCRNIVMIMTSNIGSNHEEKQRIGFGQTDNSDKFEETFKAFFRPEFRSRLDAVIKFEKLTYDIMLKITNKFINELREIVAKNYICLTASDNLLKYIAEKALKHNLGARVISTFIDREIKSQLSKIIINNVENKQLNAILDISDSEQVIVNISD